MDTEDTRSACQLEAILRYCWANKVNPDRFLDDPSATLDKVAELVDMGKSFCLTPQFEIYRNREVIEHGHRRARH